MSLQLGDDQEVDLMVQGVDDAGNPTQAAFVAPPAWVSSDESVVTVAPAAADPSGATATVVSTGKLGPATVTVTGDGGPGVTPLNASFDLEVVPTAEIGFSLVPGQPRHR